MREANGDLSYKQVRLRADQAHVISWLAGLRNESMSTVARYLIDRALLNEANNKTLRCVRCSSTYLIPEGREEYEMRRALDWFYSHPPCNEATA